MMNIFKLNRWFQKTYPNLVKEMEAADHHYSLEHQSNYHGEGNVWTHTNQVLIIAQQIEASQNASIACLLHDLGKPMTRQENHEKKRVSMYNHEAVSGFLSLEVLEKLSLETELSDEEKVNIFFAICYHIDFHKIIKECHDKQSYEPFINRYQGQPEMARILAELGIADSLGRIADPDISPNPKKLLSLIEDMDKNQVFEKMNEVKTIDSTKPTLTLLIGLPCSGKSTYTESLKDTVIISRDSLLTKNSSLDYKEAWDSKEEQTRANVEQNMLLQEAFKKKQNVCLDKTNLIKSARRKMMANAKGYNKKAVLVLEELPIIYGRNELRGSEKINEGTYKRMLADFTVPSYEEFDEIEVIYKGNKIALT